MGIRLVLLLLPAMFYKWDEKGCSMLICKANCTDTVHVILRSYQVNFECNTRAIVCGGVPS